MNRVKRAIIMAAGYGNRMLPITHTIPKPLIKVNGISMIETIIQALLKNEIEEIYIVVGYLKEQFKMLTKKYPMVSLIENPYFFIVCCKRTLGRGNDIGWRSDYL